MYRKITAILFYVMVLTTFVDLRYVQEDMLLYWRRSAADGCKPFTTWHIDCNSCVCAADGTSFCTRMGCDPERKNEVAGRDRDSSQDGEDT